MIRTTLTAYKISDGTSWTTVGSTSITSLGNRYFDRAVASSKSSVGSLLIYLHEIHADIKHEYYWTAVASRA